MRSPKEMQGLGGSSKWAAVLELSQLAESKTVVGLGKVTAFHVCTRHCVLLAQARTMRLSRRVASKQREGPQGRSRSSAALRPVQLEGSGLQGAVCPPHCPFPAPRGRAREAQSLSTEPRGAPARRARGHTLQARPANEAWRRHPERGVCPRLAYRLVALCPPRRAEAGGAGLAVRGEALQAGRQGSAFLGVATRSPPRPSCAPGGQIAGVTTASRGPAQEVVRLSRLAGPGYGARLPGWMRRR